MNINQIAKKYTREEFLNSIICDESGKAIKVLDEEYNVCPSNYGLGECGGAHCKNICWANAIKYIKFKGED